MQDFGARFTITDSMTPVLRKINDAIQLMNNNLAAANAATKLGMDDEAFKTVLDLTQDINKELDEFEKKQRKASGIQDKVTESVKRTSVEQDEVTKSIERASAATDVLHGKIGAALTAYAALQAASALVDLSDSQTSVTARLNLISDGNTAGLQEDIFAAAQDSRGDYMDMQSVVAKLGLMAGDKFDSNTEMVRFVELLNKNFVVGGASDAEQASASYQLAQAMSAGALQGDEYRSIIENAPLLAQAIEDYMRNVEGATGSMKEWAAEGMLTADVIKNAMFYSADEVEARFEQMPMTISQIGTVAYNSLVQTAQPLLEGIGTAANWAYKNWDKIAIVVKPATGAIAGYALAVGAAKVVDAGATIVKGIKNTMTILSAKYTKEEAAAVLKSTGADSLSAVAKAKLAIAAGTATVGQKLLNAAMWACPALALIGAIGGLAGAFSDYGESAGASTDELKEMEEELANIDKELSNLNGGQTEIEVMLKTKQDAYKSISQSDGFVSAIIAQQEWARVQELMKEPIDTTNYDEVNQRLDLMGTYLENIESIVPGVDDLAVAFDGVAFSIKGATAEMGNLLSSYVGFTKAQATVDASYEQYKSAISTRLEKELVLNNTEKYATLGEEDFKRTWYSQSDSYFIENYPEVAEAYAKWLVEDSYLPDDDTYIAEDTLDYVAALQSDYETALQNARQDEYDAALQAFLADSTATQVITPEYAEAENDYNTALDVEQQWGQLLEGAIGDYTSQYTDAQDSSYSWVTLFDKLGSLANSGEGINRDTSTISKAVTATAEDLKYICDIAEREVVNRFTTAEVTVNLGGITQNLSSGSDLDGIVTYVAEQMTEQLQIAADGVHS